MMFCTPPPPKRKRAQRYAPPSGVPQLGYGSRMERFERFRFSVPTVPLGKAFSTHFSTVQGDGTVPVPISVPETVSTVLVPFPMNLLR